MMDLPFSHGGPVLQVSLRASADDFQVVEELGFEPSGNGEHAFLVIEKRDTNTEWVARQLAEAAGVAPMAVGFAGLKDRHAVTRQSFSVHLPGQAGPDWSALEIPGVSIVSAQRHNRKLKRGAHRGNRFRIVLRDVRGDCAAAEQRLGMIASAGVPNYFGEQRFGRDGENLRSALALFGGARLGRSQRGFALSAARSWLFNRLLGLRVSDGSWNQGVEGEVWMLAGTHSIFGPQPHDAELLARVARFDIDPTGPLWGRGVLRSEARAAELEHAAAALEPRMAAGLVATDMAQERRSLRLLAQDLSHSWLADNALEVSFRLPAGTFATAVLRELCDWQG